MATSKRNANEAGSTEDLSLSRVVITPVKFQRARFHLIGHEDVPLVVHRFSQKLKDEMRVKAETGKAASSRKNRDPKNSDTTYNEARYISREERDGFNAACIRKACISACRLTTYKMTLAKLSIFTEKDAVDKAEPQIPLIHILDADPVKQEDMARVSTGEPYVTIRPAYFNWRAFVTIRFDSDQFTLGDVTNLLSRVGQQVGICEGRPDSKNSAGMGWGLFDIEKVAENGKG
jgi:hypothetical protein